MEVDVSILDGKTSFYFCTTCNNLFEVINNSGNKPECCGKTMKLLIPNTSDGDGEKHVPCITCEGNKVKVKIGSMPHPMQEDHYIEWIALQTSKGMYRRNLKPNCDPETCFTLDEDEEPIAACEFCNLHGLWMTPCTDCDGRKKVDEKPL